MDRVLLTVFETEMAFGSKFLHFVVRVWRFFDFKTTYFVICGAKIGGGLLLDDEEKLW